MILSAFTALKEIRDTLRNRSYFPDDRLETATTYSYHPDVLPFCPEAQYSDDEWEQATEASKLLKPESVGPVQYYVMFSAGLIYNQVRHSLKGTRLFWDWCSEVGKFENGSLFLSALPTKSIGKNYLDDILKENIRAILSVTEVYETHNEGFFTSGIKPEDYDNNGIKHLQIATPDRETIYFQLIMRGVEFIHRNLQKGRNTLVHCKAGRGRSALIEMCYLIKYQNKSAREAFNLIRSKRTQAGFEEGSPEWESLKTFEKLHPKKV